MVLVTREFWAHADANKQTVLAFKSISDTQREVRQYTDTQSPWIDAEVEYTNHHSSNGIHNIKNTADKIRKKYKVFQIWPGLICV